MAKLVHQAPHRMAQFHVRLSAVEVCRSPGLDAAYVPAVDIADLDQLDQLIAEIVRGLGHDRSGELDISVDLGTRKRMVCTDKARSEVGRTSKARPTAVAAGA